MVKDLILSAARLVGCETDLTYFLEDEDEEYAETATLFLDCFNRVENELALDYLPLVAEEELNTTTGKIVFSNLKHAVVRMIRVTDESGASLPYEVFSEYLTTRKGKVKVVYSYTPEPKSWNSESELSLYVSPRLFVYGVAAEYCMATGRYEETKVWDEKYKAAVEAAYRLHSGGKMPSRRWV